MRIVRRDNAWHVYFTRRALRWAVIAVVLAGVVVTAIAIFIHFTREANARLAEIEESAEGKLARNDWDGAIRDLDELIRWAPQYAPAFHLRGAAKAKQGKLREAIADFDTAIGLDPRLANTYYNRAIAKLNLGDAVGAINDCDAAISLSPDKPNFFAPRAYAKQRVGDINGALADCDRAISLDPKEPIHFRNRGGNESARGAICRGAF